MTLALHKNHLDGQILYKNFSVGRSGYRKKTGFKKSKEFQNIFKIPREKSIVFWIKISKKTPKFRKKNYGPSMFSPYFLSIFPRRKMQLNLL